MTPTNPLTQSENEEINAMLKAACIELDEKRINLIDDIDKSKFYAFFWFDDGDDDATFFSAYHLAAALLAGQMAARLAV